MKRFLKENVVFVGISAFLISVFVFFPYKENLGLVFLKEGENSLALTSITTQFLHAGLLHLALNIVTFFIFIKELKSHVDSKKIIIVYSISIVFLALCLIVFAQDDKMYLGNSGSCFALFGYLLMLPAENKGEKEGRLAMLLGLVISTLFIPGVSWLMHFSGLFVGIALGYLGRYIKL